MTLNNVATVAIITYLLFVTVKYRAFKFKLPNSVLSFGESELESQSFEEL